MLQLLYMNHSEEKPIVNEKSENTDLTADQESEKRFKEWIEVKEAKHFENVSRTINEGEVWWCAVGENVGIEINGKSDTFARPVLILKKLSRQGFLGVPLTSQKHTGSWYAEFEFKDKRQYAALCQIRVLSTSRLYKKMGMVPKSDLEIVQNGFRKLYY